MTSQIIIIAIVLLFFAGIITTSVMLSIAFVDKMH